MITCAFVHYTGNKTLGTKPRNKLSLMKPIGVVARVGAAVEETTVQEEFVPPPYRPLPLEEVNKKRAQDKEKETQNDAGDAKVTQEKEVPESVPGEEGVDRDKRNKRERDLLKGSVMAEAKRKKAKQNEKGKPGGTNDASINGNTSDDVESDKNVFRESP